MPVSMKLPRRTLLVLCGPAGSGKSTFAARYFSAIPTMVVSSDYCRAMICDDPTNQQVNRDTFDVFHYIIRKRLFNGRFTVADSTALHAEARRKLWELALHFGYLKCLVVFNVSLATCLERDRLRERQVGPQVIEYHIRLLQKALQEIPAEQWDRVYVLNEDDMEATIEIDP
ncbi:MAG: AAA family ATPase [Thermogemmatispora sp.]|uniref:AAA family ATPase n=1 Tax=Thermogemmatispora sp. TaxID=1968838 RepID=UPI0019F9F918|nr:AAA family ATPase [Thermogemmatispora sp.]MBE3564425.1 AAA family ATPase [Thermogemmatispora sp.]